MSLPSISCVSANTSTRRRFRHRTGPSDNAADEECRADDVDGICCVGDEEKSDDLGIADNPGAAVVLATRRPTVAAFAKIGKNSVASTATTTARTTAACVVVAIGSNTATTSMYCCLRYLYYLF
jgi:hypothetical protein